jgi:hypothetical protein
MIKLCLFLIGRDIVQSDRLDNNDGYMGLEKDGTKCEEERTESHAEANNKLELAGEN